MVWTVVWKQAEVVSWMPGALLCWVCMFSLCLWSPTSSHSPKACYELAGDASVTASMRFYWVLATFAQWRRGRAPAPPTASLSAGEALIENRWMTGWIWWTPDAGKKKHSRRILSPSSYVSPVFCLVSHVPRSCSPFWPFTSSSVWASLDCTQQLFVVWRNRLFSFSRGNRGCQHETGSLQAFVLTHPRKSLNMGKM